MALSLDIWIDRIRVHRHEAGPRIEGETTIKTTRSAWIPARVPPESAQESLSGDRPKIVQDVREVTCSMRTVDGERKGVLKSDVVEVEIGPGPNYISLGTWEVLSNQIPRNRQGEELLQDLQIVRREEY